MLIVGIISSLILQVGQPLRVLQDREDNGIIMVEVGQPVSLECDYRLEGDILYSLKWYRDDKEFFRYIPRESPPVTVFVLPGVAVTDSSSPTRVVLRNTSLTTNGLFKCEISAGPPRFQTDIRQTRIQVVDLPRYGPRIVGVDSKYQVGDLITANCISPASVPSVRLTWYINSDSATPSQVGTQRDLVRMETESGSPGREKKGGHIEEQMMGQRRGQETGQRPEQGLVSVLPLSFVVRSGQLEEGGLRLKCTASVMDLYWRSSEVATLVSTKVPSSWSLAFSSSPTIPNHTFIMSLAHILAIAYTHFF